MHYNVMMQGRENCNRECIDMVGDLSSWLSYMCMNDAMYVINNKRDLPHKHHVVTGMCHVTSLINMNTDPPIPYYSGSAL